MALDEISTAPLAHDLREALGRLNRRLRAEQPGPPFSQAIVLSRLDTDGPASVSELAAAERMRPQSMAQIVGDLEAAGLVSRMPDPHDKRRAITELTPAGLVTLRAMREQREDWLAQMLDRVLHENERALLAEAVVLLRRLSDS